MEVEQQLTNKELRKNIFVIVWPVFVEVLLGALFGMVDMMMVGKIPGDTAAAVSAVGMTNQPMFLGLSLIQALNVGGTAIIARYFGAKKYNRMGSILKHVMILAMVFCVTPTAILMLIFAPEILSLLGGDATVINVGVDYFRIVTIGFIFQSLSFTVTAALRGIGETKIPMKNNIIANSCNVLGNAILIYGMFGFPALGVTGAAIATAASNLIAMVLNVRYILSGKSILKLDFKEKFEFRAEVMRDLVRIGIPTALEQMALRFGVIMFLKIVSGLGNNVYAAHQIALNVLSLSYSPAQAFGITASSLMGQSLGAKDEKLAERYTKMCQRIGLMLAIMMSASIYFGATFLAQSHQLITSGALRGAGDTVWPLIAIFIGSCVIRLSVGYVFVNFFGWGLAGAWYAVFIDQFIRDMIILLRFRSGRWKNIRIA